MSKARRSKRENKRKNTGKLKDLTLKARQVAIVRGGVSGNEPGTLKRAGS